MAEKKEIAVNLEIKTGNTEKNLKGVEKGLSDVDKGVKKVNETPMTLDKKLENLKKEIDGGGLSMRQLTKKVQEFQTIALEAGRTSPIGKAALSEAAGLTDRLTDLRNEVKRMSNDGVMMQGALSLGSTVTAGYGALQGVMALAGQENEQLMKSLVKMQAAQSVLTGIEQIRLALEKESVLMTGIRTAQTKIATAVQAAYATVVGTSTGALKLFKVALAATGIGALIVGLGLLIANFESVTKYVKEASDTIYKIFKPQIDLVISALQYLGLVETEQSKKSRKAAKEKSDAYKQMVNQVANELEREVKLQRKLTEQKVSDMDFEIAKRQAAGEDTVEIEREKLVELMKLAKMEVQLIEEKIKAKQKEIENEIGAAKLLGKIRIDAYKVQAEAQGQGLKEIEQQLELHDIKVRKSHTDEVKRKKEARQKETKEVVDDKKDETAKLLEEQQKALQEELRIQDEQYRLLNELRETEQEKELTSLIEQFDKKFELANGNAELELALQEDLQSKIFAIEKKYSDEKDKLDEEAKAKQKQRDEEELQNKLNNIAQSNDYAQQGFEFLSNLSSAFSKDSEKDARRQFNINKASGIAQATTSTAQAIVAQLAVPQDALTGANFVKAGIAGAIGLSQIAKIASTQFQSSGGGGGGGSISVPRVTNSSAQAQANQQNDVTTNVAQLLNSQQPPVLVVDSFNKVDNEQSKIKTIGTIG